MKILVLNSGSSTLKSSLYEIGETLPEHPPVPVWDAKIEWNGEAAASVQVKTAAGKSLKKNSGVNPEPSGSGACPEGAKGPNGSLTRPQPSSRRAAVETLLRKLTDGDTRVLSSLSEIGVVGHRVVQGGRYEEPVRVTPDVKAEIARLAEFAPLHNPAELEGIELIEQILGAVPQVAVFDTAFHRTIPPAASVYAGPFSWFEQGIRRYGFHGINHEYCSQRAAQLLQRDLRSLKLVTCHLGNGCSLAAIAGGKSIDTTMGFTPLEGLMMGTRSGSIDPGIITYLLRKENLSGQQLDDLLNKQSGLLGISGVSSDMRDIETAMKRGNDRAKLAFDLFIHRLRSCLGSMIAALGGLDALVFTAGIGENSATVRAAACAGFGFLGLQLDPSTNANPTLDCDIAARESRVRVLAIRAQEAWAIARACWKLMS